MSGLEPYVPPEDRPTWVCEHACMLFAGLVGHGPGHPIVNRLIELGALPSRVDAPPRWNIADPSIVILSQNGESRERSWPGLHCEIATDPLPMADAVVDHAAGQVDELWADRLVPFEANLRTNRRAPRRQHAVLAGPDPTWPGQARRLIARLRFRVDGQVIRIDHIGSTSVPGLPAKQLIDIQVVVADLAAAARVAEAGRHSGAVHVSGRWFGTDRHGTDHPEEVLVDALDQRGPGQGGGLGHNRAVVASVGTALKLPGRFQGIDETGIAGADVRDYHHVLGIPGRGRWAMTSISTDADFL
jgi:hypothetical protein